MTNNYQLAQLNIARMLAESDDSIMADFFAQLDEVNALAERSEGFVWRLQSEEGNATEIRVFEDTMMIVNMSVWESIESLYQFTYYSAHTEVYRRRSEWFHKPQAAIMVLWWIPVGTLPTLDDAKSKLELLRTYGATPEAFTFKTCFNPNGEPITAKGEKVV